MWTGIVFGDKKKSPLVRSKLWVKSRWTSNSSQSTEPVGQVLWEEYSRKSNCILLPYVRFISNAFKGQVHVFAGQMKIVSHLSCMTSAILKYFCPLVFPFFLWVMSHENLLLLCAKHKVANQSALTQSEYHPSIGDSFQDYSWILDFEADFPQPQNAELGR